MKPVLHLNNFKLKNFFGVFDVSSFRLYRSNRNRVQTANKNKNETENQKKCFVWLESVSSVIAFIDFSMLTTFTQHRQFHEMFFFFHFEKHKKKQWIWCNYSTLLTITLKFFKFNSNNE